MEREEIQKSFEVRSANSAAGSGGSLSSQELSEELSEVGYECYAVVEFESLGEREFERKCS